LVSFYDLVHDKLTSQQITNWITHDIANLDNYYPVSGLSGIVRALPIDPNDTKAKKKGTTYVFNSYSGIRLASDLRHYVEITTSQPLTRKMDEYFKRMASVGPLF